jgi:hypothetical protein
MLKRWNFRRYFGIRAPRLEIRPRFVGLAYALGGAAVVLSIVLLLSFFPREQKEAPNVQDLQARISQLEDLLKENGTLDLEITYSANRQLRDELSILADKQAALEDDLVYLLRLVPVGMPEGGLKLDRLSVRQDPLSEETYHFSVLVGYASGRTPQEFKGVLNFTLTVMRDGKEVHLPWPAADQANRPEYQIAVRHWVRKTGTLEIMPGDVLQKVELKLLQGNALRATATVDL